MSAYFKGASSVEEAIEGALQSCEEGKKENTWENPIGECKLYAIGDIIVSGMTEREIKETIIRYQLAVIETDPNLRDLSPGLSRRGSKSFVDYKRKVHFRAFATTEAGGERESVHGRSWRSSTVQEATKRAVEQCEKARSNEGITSECKLYAIGNIVVYRMSPEDLEAAMTFYQANFDADNDEFDALVLNDPTNGSANLLSETEIRAKIIGNTMTEFSTRQGTQWTELYLQDGTIEGVYSGDRGFIAEWHLDGSRMCWDYSPGTEFDGCWPLALNGREVVFYEDKKVLGRAQLLQDNPKGL